MDDLLFDRLARMFGAGGSRRDALLALVAASPLALLIEGAEAKKPTRRRITKSEE